MLEYIDNTIKDYERIAKIFKTVEEGEEEGESQEFVIVFKAQQKQHELRGKSYLIVLDLRDLKEHFDQNHKRSFQKKQVAIQSWQTKALDKLYALPDEKILIYFPNTGEEDLLLFRSRKFF